MAAIGLIFQRHGEAWTSTGAYQSDGLVSHPSPSKLPSSNTSTRPPLDIDAAIGRARRQIELLREYRTRLIADVVTGKLDVRAAAAQLPEQPDDQDPVELGFPTEDTGSRIFRRRTKRQMRRCCDLARSCAPSDDELEHTQK